MATKEQKEKQILSDAVLFEAVISQSFTKEMEDQDPIEIHFPKDGDITNLLTSMTLGYLSVLGKMTRTQGNWFDKLYMAQRLLLQYTMRFGKITDDDEDDSED